MTNQKIILVSLFMYSCKTQQYRLPSLVASCPSEPPTLRIDMGETVRTCDTSGLPRRVSPEQLLNSLRRSDVDSKIEDFAVGKIGYMLDAEVLDVLRQNNLLENVALIQLEAGANSIRAGVLIGDFERTYCFVFDPQDANHLTRHFVKRL